MSDEQAYEEGYRWLYKILRDAGYDPNRENPEAFAKRTRIAEEENERLRAWVTTGVEENERLRGLIEQQAGQLEEEQSQTGWLREQVIESKEENERLRAEVQASIRMNKLLVNGNERLREVYEGVLAAPELQARIDAALAKAEPSLRSVELRLFWWLDNHCREGWGVVREMVEALKGKP